MAIFLISDTHFEHTSMYEKVYAGNRLRPWNTYEEGDNIIIERWNNTVNESDTVFHLGDIIGQTEESLSVLARLNGNKVLIRGNHDTGDLALYTKYFSNVYGCYELGDLLLTHIPAHPMLRCKNLANVHGHMHGLMMDVDPWYFDVSVEVINYTPILLEDLLIKIKERQESPNQFTYNHISCI